ncbi:hypothetical protein C8J56DRAFT_175199 [Mycena floridula]|nr:hypothetical protein C8J56DRAFT_175199 [Mycena floridula]
MQSTLQYNSVISKPRRATIACRNCRKRKIKCETQENPPWNPCERCVRKKLQCEYITVADDPSSANETPQPQQSRGQVPLYQPLHNNTPSRGSDVSPGSSSSRYNPLGPGYVSYPGRSSGYTNFSPADSMRFNSSGHSMQYSIDSASAKNQQFQSYSSNNSLQQANTGHNYWMNDPASQPNQYPSVPTQPMPNVTSKWPQSYQQGSVPFQQQSHPRGCICSYCAAGRV